MTKLSDTQKDQIDNLIQYTILPALQEDVCVANMDDVPKSDSNWEEICEERMNVLYVEALKYLKNNLE
jgi:hypothetical protein